LVGKKIIYIDLLLLCFDFL